MEDRALIAFVLALALTAAVTPLVARLARRVGALDPVQERGLASEPTPLLGGLAILAGVLVAGVLLLPATTEMRGILIAALLITVVGLLDDLIDLPPQLKLLGQVAAGLICVLSGVRVDDFTFPFVGRVDLGDLGGPLTLIGLVLVMNVVNFSDGVDGLAAGVCAISAIGFAVIAFDLSTRTPPASSPPAPPAPRSASSSTTSTPRRSSWATSGSNLLGLLLGGVIVEGSLKTNALIALVVPLVILAVPFLDTGFVVAKRIKYRRPVYRADSNHFHHRFHRMGFSQRKTVLYLYAWTTTMTVVAVALRFVPYSESNGHLNAGWAIVMGAMLLVGLGASIYLVYVLEILKLRRLRAWQLRREDPDTSEHEIDDRLEEDLETGEFTALR